MAEKVVLTLHVWQEDDHWIGECVELGTITDACSPEAVLDELVELVMLTVERWVTPVSASGYLPSVA